MKNKTNLKEHIKENKSLDWCDLAYKIICLEDELFNLNNYLTKQTKAMYLQVIEDCESEKSLRVSNQFNGSRYLQKQVEKEMFSEE
jgi:hypothetical protein